MSKFWNVPIPEHLDKQLTEFVEGSNFATKSEFIRTAVRDRLAEERRKKGQSKEIAKFDV